MMNVYDRAFWKVHHDTKSDQSCKYACEIAELGV